MFEKLRLMGVLFRGDHAELLAGRVTRDGPHSPPKTEGPFDQITILVQPIASLVAPLNVQGAPEAPARVFALVG